MARASATPDAATSRPSPVRERILAAADELFYGEGIRAVSADRIIAAAAVSKVTFYRHFPTKDDLVLAYLDGRAAAERGALDGLRTGDACAMLTGIAHALADASCASGFRGCPFINAAAEYADPGHPVRQAVAAHRAWFAGLLRDLLAELGIGDSSTVVDQLMMLRDGAMVGGYLGAGSDSRAGALIEAGRAVIETARR
ncbi:TetR/AcrR family transcriptional regulator [Amycolatopsis sp. K13G38]|uniref:TetR/AcrR family transcriptional regulator n=1 Tax=Amycolatopsis acididurans TaxID=2724524 RepID=A0ABX1JGR3_9PSEU|nr:TetR/AcrR family transcriptional regulator [Amycolatopsis acididurans]NKQ58993.1 TetR/AcrR family transcriptional regulator [Amycolatopsis acididurans]